MAVPNFIRKMHSVVRRSLLCSCVLVVLVVCLTYGVLGKSVPEKHLGKGEAQWYNGKDLKLVHVVSLSIDDLHFSKLNEFLR